MRGGTGPDGLSGGASPRRGGGARRWCAGSSPPPWGSGRAGGRTRSLWKARTDSGRGGGDGRRPVAVDEQGHLPEEVARARRWRSPRRRGCTPRVPLEDEERLAGRRRPRLASSRPSSTSTSVPSEATASSSCLVQVGEQRHRGQPVQVLVIDVPCRPSRSPERRERSPTAGSGRAEGGRPTSVGPVGLGYAPPDLVMTSQHSVPRDASLRPPALRSVATVAVVALAALGALGATSAAAETMVHPGPPSLDGAQNALAEAQAQRADAMASAGPRAQADLAATRQRDQRPRPRAGGAGPRARAWPATRCGSSPSGPTPAAAGPASSTS